MSTAPVNHIDLVACPVQAPFFLGYWLGEGGGRVMT